MATRSTARTAARRTARPNVWVAMGSDSDLPVMAECVRVLEEHGVASDVRVLSAHRTPDQAVAFAREAEGRGFKVLIAGAGGSAHLAGVVAAHTPLPVIGVPPHHRHASDGVAGHQRLDLLKGGPFVHGDEVARHETFHRRVTQSVVPCMRQARFGRIVSISSRAILGKTQRLAYAAGKAGLIGMTRVLCLELAGDGITINAVAPGPVATELFDNGHPIGSAKRQAVIDSIPVKWVGTPRDVARAVSFFLSPDSGYISGQTLFVCGGSRVSGSGGN